jgi:hypothetical protein
MRFYSSFLAVVAIFLRPDVLGASSEHATGLAGETNPLVGNGKSLVLQTQD